MTLVIIYVTLEVVVVTTLTTIQDGTYKLSHVYVHIYIYIYTVAMSTYILVISTGALQGLFSDGLDAFLIIKQRSLNLVHLTSPISKTTTIISKTTTITLTLFS